MRMSSVEQYDVIVIGAGISGLACAQVLKKEGLNVIVLEARHRHGGRIHTVQEKLEDSEVCTFDLGANYLHGCVSTQSAQPLFTLAHKLQVKTVCCPGDILEPHRGWECPEVALWRDHTNGEIIPLSEVTEMSYLMDRCLLRVLSDNMSNKSKKICELSIPLKKALETNLNMLYKNHRRASPTLSKRECGILYSLLARYVSYVNPLTRISSKLSLGPHFTADAEAGYADDPDQPNESIKAKYLDWLHRKQKYLIENKPEVMVAKRVGKAWEDRLVLSGFGTFTDYLADDLVIKYNTVVKSIDWSQCLTKRAKQKRSLPSTNLSSVRCIQVDSRASTPSDVLPSTHSCRMTNKFSPDHSDLQNLSRHTRRTDCSSYRAPYCVVTLPVGVLKGLDRRSAVQFHPELPTDKRTAINRLGIPKVGADTHNKVVLIFRHDDVFWDVNVPQIECPDPRVHLLNLHYYGQRGLLVAHVWAGAGFQLAGRTDANVVSELLRLLQGMYPAKSPLPSPRRYWVTRWSEDPFSLGSYTEGEVGSGDADRHAYASSLPSSSEPHLLFAGESTIDSSGGQQCTHGAFLSGVQRAVDILNHRNDMLGRPRCRLDRQAKIIDYLTGGPTRTLCSTHSMKRRGMPTRTISSPNQAKALETDSSDLPSSSGLAGRKRKPQGTFSFVTSAQTDSHECQSFTTTSPQECQPSPLSGASIVSSTSDHTDPMRVSDGEKSETLDLNQRGMSSSSLSSVNTTSTQSKSPMQPISFPSQIKVSSLSDTTIISTCDSRDIIPHKPVVVSPLKICLQMPLTIQQYELPISWPLPSAAVPSPTFGEVTFPGFLLNHQRHSSGQMYINQYYPISKSMRTESFTKRRK